MNDSLNRLTRWLCGSFNNQQQAFENPPLYGHIHVRYRPGAARATLAAD